MFDVGNRQMHKNNEHDTQGTFLKPYSCDRNLSFQFPAVQQVKRTVEKKQTSIDTFNNDQFAPSIDKGNSGQLPKSPALQMDKAGTQNITNLHSKLYSDIDKIRKWKIETDIEYKQKAKELQDARQTVENQRKMLLKLQLENEKLSLNLKEEMQARNEINDKIKTTRDLILTLKEQTDKVDSKMSHWEGVKSLFEKTNHTRLQEYEGLSVKLQDLNCQYKDKTAQLNMIILEEQKQRQQLTEQMNLELADAGKQLERFHETVESKELHIQQLNGDLINAEQSIERFKKNHREFQIKLKESEENLLAKQMEVVSLTEKLHNLQVAKSDLEANLKEKTQACNLEKEAATQLQNELDKLHQKLEKEESSLQTTKDQFAKETNDMKLRCSVLEEKLAKCTSELVEKTAKIENLKATIQTSQQENEKSKNDVTVLIRDKRHLDELLMKEKEIVDMIKTEYNAKETKAKTAVKEMKAELELQKASKESLSVELKEYEHQLNAKYVLIEELQGVKDDLTKEKNRISNELVKMKEDIEFLREEKDILDIHLSELNQEKEAVVDDSSKIRNDLAETKRAVEELQKCNAELINDNLNKTNKLNADNDSLKLQLQNAKREFNEQKNILEEQLQSLNEKVEEDESSFSKSSEEMKATHESQMKEMMHLLNKTQQDHYKTVKQKDEELNQLRGNVNSYKDKMKMEQIKDKEIERLQNEINELQNQLEDSETNAKDMIIKFEKKIKEGEKKVETMDCEHKNLQQQLVEMQEEVEELEKSNEKLRKQNERLSGEIAQQKKHSRKADDLNKQAMKYKDENSQLIEKLDEQRSETENVQKKMEKTDVLNKHLLEENMKLHKQADEKDDLEKKIGDLEEENQQLKTLTQTLKDKLNADKENDIAVPKRKAVVDVTTLSTPKQNARSPYLERVMGSGTTIGTPKAGILKKDGPAKSESTKQVQFTSAYDSDNSSPESKAFQHTLMMEAQKAQINAEPEVKRKSVRVAPSPRTLIPQEKKARLSWESQDKPLRVPLTRLNEAPKDARCKSPFKTYTKPIRKPFKTGQIGHRDQTAMDSDSKWDAFNLFND